MLSVLYGAGAYRLGWFPSSLVKKAANGYDALKPQFSNELPWGYVYKAHVPQLRNTHLQLEDAQEGINLITEMGANNRLLVRLETLKAELLYEWNLNWFELWPNAAHLPSHILPKSEPGTFVHGTVLLPNGHLVFNFEYCGMLCVDTQGNVVWRLPYSSHHSLHLGPQGNLWACGLAYEKNPKAQNEECTVIERQTIIEVSTEGKLLNEWKVEDLLTQSGLTGYLYLMPRKCNSAHLLHLNDVEPVHSDVLNTGSWFQEGDVLFSLRNVNTVFVFNRFTQKVRKGITGPWIAQHDPDVRNGTMISVYDNGHGAKALNEKKSRIASIDLLSGAVTTTFEGTENVPFYSEKLGKHQWLHNGNLLVTASQQGRAFELNPKGEVVWCHNNEIAENLLGYVIEVQRLPSSYALPFQ